MLSLSRSKKGIEMLSSNEIHAWHRTVTDNPNYLAQYCRIGWLCDGCRIHGVIEHKASEFEDPLDFDITQDEIERIKRVLATEAFEQAADDHAAVSPDCDRKHGGKYLSPCAGVDWIDPMEPKRRSL